MIPLLLVRPTVGLSPKIPLMEAGPMMDESVSVPNASGTILAVTATADPELEPSRDLDVSPGIQVGMVTMTM